MPKTVFQAQAVLNTARGTAMAAWTPRAALYVGDPTLGGSEVVGGSYSRVNLTFGSPSGTTMTNSVVAAFPTPTALWGVLTHAGLVDAMVGGNLRYVYQLAGSDADRTVGIGSTPVRLEIGTVILGEL